MRLFKVFLFVFFAFCIAFIFYFVLSYFQQKKPLPSPITAIIQTGPLREGLKTTYLAEQLGLSFDSPSIMTPEKAEKILRDSPLIKKVTCSLSNPETLYIDYTLRSPQFILGDIENLALDEEGVSFPLRPFFTPKHLPKIYLGEGDHELKREIATSLLDMFGEKVKTIDVSKCFEKSLGKREIVVRFGPHLLRLTPKRYKEEISHYMKIQKQLDEDPLIIDLRIPNLAFISSNP